MAGNIVIGATLTLRDNMSATLKGVRSELSVFSRNVETTRKALERMARQRNEVRIDTASAIKSISRIRSSIEPLKDRIVIRAAVQDDATGEIRRIRDEAAELGNQAVAPVVRVKDEASNAVKGIKSKFEALKPLASGIMTVGSAVWDGVSTVMKSGATLEDQQLAVQHSIGVNNPGKSAADVAGISADFMKDLRNNSNDTHILTSDVVGAGASAVSVTGGDTKGAMELVKLSEDMAALNPGKTISEAMEALASAKNGSMDGLQEFGVKVSEDEFKSYAGKGKDDNMSESDTKTAFGMLVDKKLSPSFKGGATEQADTGTGLVSAVVGKTGSLIQDTGLKMLERLKPAMKSVIALIDQYSPQIEKLGLKIADGIGFAVSKLPALKQHLIDAFEASKPTIAWITNVGFPKISELLVKVGTGLKNTFEFLKPGLVWMGTVGLPAIVDILGGVMDKAALAYNFFKTNWSTLKPFIEGIAIAFGAYKVVMGAIELKTIAVTAAQSALNFAMNLNPIGLIILSIGLLIGGLILLYNNFDTVKTKVSEVGVAIKNGFIMGVNGAIDLINGLIGALKNIPGFGNIPLIGKIALDTSGNSTADGMQAVRGSHANGLDYVPFDGYIAELHKGERVQRASENPYNGTRSSSSASSKSNGKSLSIAKLADTIIVREEADIDKIANALLLKINETALNMA
ncbi:hypothetical protein [Desulfosporosinus sp. SB140]|uniref:hypothetical protein n=1 Tax=Desulfosporosinus paludis TaxID=3115649 RepID=UPI00388FFE0B